MTNNIIIANANISGGCMSQMKVNGFFVELDNSPYLACILLHIMNIIIKILTFIILFKSIGIINFNFGLHRFNQ